MSTPIVTSISPSVGPIGGGTLVEIAGSGLSTATEPDDVQFGDVPAAAVVSVTDTLLTVTSPQAPGPGEVTVSVITPNGAVITANAFDYQVEVGSIQPASGPVTGGTTVTFTGSGMLSVKGVRFGATAAAGFTAPSDTTLTATTPAAANPGSVDVILTGVTGEYLDIELAGFSYLAAPATPGGSGNSGGGTSDGSGQGGASPGQQPGTQPGQPGTQPGQSGQTGTAGQQQGGQPGKQPGTPGQPGKNPPGQSDTPPGQTGTPPTQTGTPPAQTGTPPSQNQGTPGQPAKTPPATTPPGTSPSGTPQPSGDYIPGGLAPVPDGKTGLGGTAGTGAGFSVGTLLPGGGGSAAPSNLPYYVDPGYTDKIVQSLISLVQTAVSPDAIEAQSMILRRMALEGDVVGSRIPPPRNVSEIGGYINLLSSLGETTMRQQALAGVLGVAGPAQPLGWISNNQPLSLAAVPNDRPAVVAQPSFPLSFLVRSDFVAGLQSALKTLHAYGATLPLTSPSAITLPPGGTGAVIPHPVLYYLGRMLQIAPSAALANPAADPVALILPGGPSAGYVLASQVLNPAVYTVPLANLTALQCTPAACAQVQLTQVQFVPVAPILATAGFYPAAPLPVPATSGQTAWSVLTNTAGLVHGVTTLGEELSLLYRQDQIAASAFAAMLAWTWNGTAFAP